MEREEYKKLHKIENEATMRIRDFWLEYNAFLGDGWDNNYTVRKEFHGAPLAGFRDGLDAIEFLAKKVRDEEKDKRT